MHNISSNISVSQALSPQTIQAAALNTGNIDTRGADATSIVVLVGDIVETLSGSVRIDLKIEHADDDGTGAPGSYAACADDDVINFTGLTSGIFASIDAGSKELKRYMIDYRGGRRFVKVTATPTGISTGGPIAMLALKGRLSQMPAVNT